jgi:hypothetical protein
MEQSVPETTAPGSSFGEKVFESRCKAAFSAQATTVDTLAEVWSQGLLIKPDSSNSTFAPYTESVKVEAANYKVSLTTTSGAVITLSQFGANYDHFAQVLTEGWGDAMAKALLMVEPKISFEATCYISSQPQQTPVPCRARIYETALVLFPSNGMPLRLPFSTILAVDLESYKVRIKTSDRGIIELSRLGNATQFFVDKTTEAMKEVEASSLEIIKANVPSATFDELQKLSRLTIEGRAAYRKDVEAISTELWAKLEKYLESSPVLESYNYLSGLAETSLEAVGLRKAMDSVYVWFMMPLMGSVVSGGNVVALEVTSESGHATYLFRVMPRLRFPTATREQFLGEAEVVIRDLNEALIATGFRREPIYLTDDQLTTPEYSKYLYASKHLDPLRLLRERFVARIIHSTFDQWRADLGDALHFNTAAKDDVSRWPKNRLDFVESPQATQVEPAPMASVPEPSRAAPVTHEVEVQTLSPQVTTTPVMAERAVVLSRLEGDDKGNVKLLLHDPEFDHDIWVMMSGDDAAKLAAFPGTKLKLTVQKG